MVTAVDRKANGLSQFRVRFSSARGPLQIFSIVHSAQEMTHASRLLSRRAFPDDPASIHCNARFRGPLPSHRYSQAPQAHPQARYKQGNRFDVAILVHAIRWPWIFGGQSNFISSASTWRISSLPL